MKRIIPLAVFFAFLGIAFGQEVPAVSPQVSEVLQEVLVTQKEPPVVSPALIPEGQKPEPEVSSSEPAAAPGTQLASLEALPARGNVIGMDGNISLDLRNIDVVEALKFLAMKAGVNIISTSAVKGRVTLRVENVLTKDIFDMMLRTNRLAYEKRENIFHVMTEEEYKALYGKTFSDVREVKIFHLGYAIPEQIFSLCDTLKSDIGRILVSPESGTVVVMDSPAKLEQIGAAIESFEKQSLVKVFNLNYANAKDVAEQIKNQIEAKKVGMVKADERTNQVIVQTLPERMDQIEALIHELDRKTREVLIEAKVIRVNLRKDLTEEYEWEGLFEAVRNSSGLTYVGSYPFSSVQGASDPWRSRKTILNGGTAPDGTVIAPLQNVGSFPFSYTTSDVSASVPQLGLGEMHVGMVGVHDFNTTLRLLEGIGETEIVGTPQITVANNQEAKLHVGEKQAYVTTTTTTGQSTSTVSEDVTFVDVGLQMFVTPAINEEGYVTLKIKSEISNVVDVLVTPTRNRIPIISTNVAETTVFSKTGTTIVIGGLRQNVKTNTEKKTPVLGDIPLVGRLFKSKKPSTVRTEVLILITPTIISGDVLVGPAGRPMGERLIKPGKDYMDYQAVDGSVPAAESDFTEVGRIKGFKFDE